MIDVSSFLSRLEEKLIEGCSSMNLKSLPDDYEGIRKELNSFVSNKALDWFDTELSREISTLTATQGKTFQTKLSARLNSLRPQSIYFRNTDSVIDKYSICWEVFCIHAHYFKSIVDHMDAGSSSGPVGKGSVKEVKDSLEDLTNEKSIKYTLKLLEDLKITGGGVSILSQRNKGAIRGIVEALREENILPMLSLERLTGAISKQIGLELKSKLDWSKTSEAYSSKAKEYIKSHPFR